MFEYVVQEVDLLNHRFRCRGHLV